MKKQRTKKVTGQLYKRGKKGTYYLEWIFQGNRFKKSLGTTDEDQAKIEREKILRPLQANTFDQVHRELKHSITDAEEQKAIEEEALREKLSLADTWEAFIQSTNRPDTGEATLRQYKFQWETFVKWMKDNHSDVTDLIAVNKEHADGYVTFIRDDPEKKLAKGTINKHVRLCKLVFTALEDQEKLTLNPFAHIRSLKDTQNHRKEIAWDKLVEIFNAAEGEMKLLFFIGIYTGLRLGDCCLLTWDEVDLIRGWILTVPNKTARHDDSPLHIPIMKALGNMLEDIPKHFRKGYVIKNMAKKYLKSRDNVTDMVQDLFKSCGVQIHKTGTGRYYDKEKKKYVGKRAVLQYGFHSLRHTTVTILQEAGVPQAVVQAIVGHRTLAMTQRYTHVGDKALKEAVNNIPLIGTAEDQKKTKKLLKAREEMKVIVDKLDIKQLKALKAALSMLPIKNI